MYCCLQCSEMQRRGSRGAPTGGVGGMGATKGYDGKIAGLYDLETTLGRGHYAVVKMARHVFTGEKVAVKVIDKSKLDGLSKEHLFQEVGVRYKHNFNFILSIFCDFFKNNCSELNIQIY